MTEAMFAAMAKCNIHPTFLPDDIDDHTSKTGRLVFDVDFENSRYSHLVVYMSKGMVIGMPDKKVLTYPKQSLTYLTPHNQAAVSKAEYTVYPARDGSIVTLYTYKGKLSMSSSSSPDISTSRWNNDKTFAELFMHSASLYPEFVSAVNLALSVETGLLSWNLPANIAVTFGMRNHNIHRLEEDPECIWLVHAMDMNKRNVVELPELSSLERDKPLEANYTIPELIQKAGSSSLDVALFARDSSRFNYGYLLDSKAYRVFIPSTLYMLLRDTLYRKIVGVRDITKKNRYIYNVMYLALCKKEQQLDNIRKLIPELSPVVDSVRKFLENVCLAVKKYVQNPQLECDVDDIIVTIGETIISNECDYNPVEHTKYDILPLYVYHPMYVKELYKTYLKQ